MTRQRAGLAARPLRQTMANGSATPFGGRSQKRLPEVVVTRAEADAVRSRLEDFTEGDEEVRAAYPLDSQPEVAPRTKQIAGFRDNAGIGGAISRARAEDLARRPDLVLIDGQNGDI